MRNAHRPKALPNRKLPRGIERQDELIELIEKRFHQEDLIRSALQKADAKSTTAEITSAEEIAAEGVPSKQDATTQESAYADEVTAESVPSKQDATTSESAPSADGSAPAEAIADSTPAEEITASTADTSDTSDALESVTIRWHGQNETITDPRIWLTVFDTVREAGDVITREVAHRRFHGESYWKTCDALYLSTGTYYHHVRAILHYAFACAVYHRLIDPRPKHFSLKAK